MNLPSRERPVCIVIAGPNGAGKTTFAQGGRAATKMTESVSWYKGWV